MKKLCSILIVLLILTTAVLPTFAADTSDSFGAYDHVFIIGVDGAGGFFDTANTPEFDRIFASGAVDYKARAEVVTVSAQNWGAILTGVSFLKHKMTNDILSETPRTSDTQYPSLFALTRKAMPDAVLASFVNWNAINVGLIETDVDATKVNETDDLVLTDEICAYFDAGNTPTMFFVQFDSVDHYGHESGNASPEFIQQIETIDGCIGRIYDTLTRNGLIENSLFIVVSDHGHTRKGGHGGLTAGETYTTLAVAGKTVAAGGTMDACTRNRDVAAIALYALGIERPDYMTSRIPANVFTDVAGERRNVWKDLPDALLSALTWPLTLIQSVFA